MKSPRESGCSVANIFQQTMNNLKIIPPLPVGLGCATEQSDWHHRLMHCAVHGREVLPTSLTHSFAQYLTAEMSPPILLDTYYALIRFKSEALGVKSRFDSHGCIRLHVIREYAAQWMTCVGDACAIFQCSKIFWHDETSEPMIKQRSLLLSL